jgi:hypothetical protein
LLNCKEIPLEWKDHIDKYRDSQYKGTILIYRFIENNGNDKENTNLKQPQRKNSRMQTRLHARRIDRFSRYV